MLSETDATAPLFDRRIHPHRSLAPRHARWLILAVGALGLALSIPFYLMGAWPVVGFMGLDVLLVSLAFRASFRQARAYEHIGLSSLELHLSKVNARGQRRDWRFNPMWVRLDQQEHEEFGVQKLSLVSRGRGVVVGAFLGPEQKAEFAGQLIQALHIARRGPRF